MRKEYADSQAKPSARRVPACRAAASRRVGARSPQAPTQQGRLRQVVSLTSLVRQGLPVRELSKEHPEANVAAPRPEVVAARAARLGAGLVGRRHERGLVQARPRAVPRPRQAVGRDPRPAGEGVAGAGRSSTGTRCPTWSRRRPGPSRSKSRPSRSPESAWSRCFPPAASPRFAHALAGRRLHGRGGRGADRVRRRMRRWGATRRRRRCGVPRDGSRARDADPAVAAAGAGPGRRCRARHCRVWSTRCARPACSSARSARCARCVDVRPYADDEPRLVGRVRSDARASTAPSGG